MVLYKFITNLILNVKYTKLIKKVYNDEDLLNKFSQLFGTEFRMDWVGRIYTVINPNIINDKFDINTQIFEYNEEGLTNNVYIERWIMGKFNLVKDFIMAMQRKWQNTFTEWDQNRDSAVSEEDTLSR